MKIVEKKIKELHQEIAKQIIQIKENKELDKDTILSGLKKLKAMTRDLYENELMRP